MSKMMAPVPFVSTQGRTHDAIDGHENHATNNKKFWNHINQSKVAVTVYKIQHQFKALLLNVFIKKKCPIQKSKERNKFMQV